MHIRLGTSMGAARSLLILFLGSILTLATSGSRAEDLEVPSGAVAGDFQLGDLNCDGALNGADIDPFFLALGDPARHAALFPLCDGRHADVDRSGHVDGADIDAFFVCISAGRCP